MNPNDIRSSCSVVSELPENDIHQQLIHKQQHCK